MGAAETGFGSVFGQKPVADFVDRVVFRGFSLAFPVGGSRRLAATNFRGAARAAEIYALCSRARQATGIMGEGFLALGVGVFLFLVLVSLCFAADCSIGWFVNPSGAVRRSSDTRTEMFREHAVQKMRPHGRTGNYGMAGRSNYLMSASKCLELVGGRVFSKFQVLGIARYGASATSDKAPLSEKDDCRKGRKNNIKAPTAPLMPPHQEPSPTSSLFHPFLAFTIFLLLLFSCFTHFHFPALTLLFSLLLPPTFVLRGWALSTMCLTISHRAVVTNHPNNVFGDHTKNIPPASVVWRLFAPTPEFTTPQPPKNRIRGPRPNFLPQQSSAPAHPNAPPP